MISFFRKRPLLSDQDFEFLVETYAWLLRFFGGDDFYREAVLVLPTRDFFPSEVSSPDQAANEVFNKVKEYSGMKDWPCRLQRQEDDVDAVVGPALAVREAPRNALGTFSIDESEQIVITYNPSVVGDPVQMVATFAHELAHYLTSAAPEPPPGGWENWEFATDIAAGFLGFGVFMAGSVFSFRQFSDLDSPGWQSSRNGYLTEVEHIYALAIFLRLKKIEGKAVLPFLKPSLGKLLKRALVELDKTDVINGLSRVEFVGL